MGKRTRNTQRPFMRYLILLITDKAKALRLSTLFSNVLYIEKIYKIFVCNLESLFEKSF